HQANNPGNDSYIRQVKNVPVEVPIRRGNVKKHKICDPAVGDAIHRIADSAADDESKRNGSKPVFCPCEPYRQQQHCRGLECEQYPQPDRPLGLKQAVADSPVAGENDVEERAYAHRSIGRKIEHKQQIQFTGLVEEASDRRDGKSKTCLRANELQALTPPPCAWLPIRATPAHRAARRPDIPDRRQSSSEFSTSARIWCLQQDWARRQRPPRPADETQYQAHCHGRASRPK